MPLSILLKRGHAMIDISPDWFPKPDIDEFMLELNPRGTYEDLCTARHIIARATDGQTGIAVDHADIYQLFSGETIYSGIGNTAQSAVGILSLKIDLRKAKTFLMIVSLGQNSKLSDDAGVRYFTRTCKR